MKLTPEQMYYAYCLGAKTAQGYKIGDLFLGAYGEAKRMVDPELRSLFVDGFLNHLPRPITCDHNNIIVRIGRTEHSA
jgi:hypothetical protein